MNTLDSTILSSSPAFNNHKQVILLPCVKQQTDPYIVKPGTVSKN